MRVIKTQRPCQH
uniref:Truncated envelope glycoprotein n=1 Tax=Human immunodeficiency virus type 1 TaxID=11676 RepID=A0A0H3YCV6_HV1|nr:truncated envelope glycoprotein [Human immunodeficiency virus 1]